MKIAASILLMIWGFLIVQPVFAYFGGKAAYQTCNKTTTIKPACSKNKTCNKSSESQDNNNCKNDICNPTLGCSSGNLYVHHHYQISLPSWFAQKQKLIATDDNRIFNNMSECWHPPEA